jgi:hypothetical protein
MSEQLIRVSCASLCRIEHQGRYFLLLNRNRRQKGIYILSPIGGALAVDDPSLFASFDATPENRASNDLRMTMPTAALPRFRVWFYRREGREISPYRELQEELVIESGLLPALPPGEVEWELLWTVEEREHTQRKGQTGLLTQYFLEIYGVRFKTFVTRAALVNAPPESGAAWVTREQIDSGGPVPLEIDGARHEAQVNGKLLVQPPSDPLSW